MRDALVRGGCTVAVLDTALDQARAGSFAISDRIVVPVLTFGRARNGAKCVGFLVLVESREKCIGDWVYVQLQTRRTRGTKRTGHSSHGNAQWHT